jgi:hypothetical protein
MVVVATATTTTSDLYIDLLSFLALDAKGGVKRRLGFRGSLFLFILYLRAWLVDLLNLCNV